jgi:hypothetical protein
VDREPDPLQFIVPHKQRVLKGAPGVYLISWSGYGIAMTEITEISARLQLERHSKHAFPLPNLQVIMIDVELGRSIASHGLGTTSNSRRTAASGFCVAF